ncbi:MAG: hypothetical protein ABGY72_16245, partial [bacterium]
MSMSRWFTACVLVAMPTVALAQASFELGPESQRQTEVPRGEVTPLRWENSRVYRNTERDWWI